MARDQVRSSKASRKQRPLHLEALEDRTVLSAAAVGNLVVLGDSLADVGNVALATQGAIPNSAVYAQGRFSGGPIWVDTMAKYLNKPAVQPSLAGGLDYAFGGATVAATAAAPFNVVPTLAQQVGEYLTGKDPAGKILSHNTAHTPSAKDVFAVWAGANDFFDTVSAPTGPISPIKSAETLENSLKTLADAGARRFVVNNLPPLGETPYIRALNVPGLSAGADGWATAFNAELKTDLNKLKAYKPGMIVVQNDVAGLFQKAAAPSNPYGFVNTTNAVGSFTPPSVFLTSVTASNAANYLFFDGVHPTSKAHQLIGLQATAGLETALGVHDLVVTSTADTVDPTAHGLSLREMVNLANAMPGDKTITFALGAGPHQIELTGTELAITRDLVLRGPAEEGALKINAQGHSRIFEVASQAHVHISHLDLIRGSADKGGAIANAGDLQLDKVGFLFNTAPLGGAIFNTGTLQMNHDTLTSNNAVSGSSATGGAIVNSGASADATIKETVFHDNQAIAGAGMARGGAIANLGGAKLKVVSSVIAANSVFGAKGWGGGIFNAAGSTLTIRDSVLYGNHAKGANGLGGGIYLASGSLLHHSNTLSMNNDASTSGPNVYKAA